MKIKRTLSIIIALVMVLSLCSISAYAEEETYEHTRGTGLGDLANMIYEMVTGQKVEVQPTTEDHVCHYASTAYVCKNAVQHYVQWKCSCGRVLMAYDEAHRIGWDLTCSLCGFGMGGNGQHTHAEASRTYTQVDANNHRVDVYCACGALIDSFLEPHSLGDDGICALCGYNSHNGSNDGNKDNGNKDSGDKDPVSGEFEGHRYTVIYSRLTWKEAKALAENAGSHLAVITSAEEEAFIESLNVHNGNLWIGGYYANDAWNWVTAEAWDYENWAQNKPQDSANSSYTAMFPQLWCNLKNNSLTKLDGFVIEGEVTAVVNK